MAALCVLSALLMLGSGTGLPAVAAEADILELGGLFDNESSMAVMTMLQKRQCVPKDLNLSKQMMALATCFQAKSCPGAAKDDVIYDCLARRTGLISGNKFNATAFGAFIGGFAIDPAWVAEKRPLADACLAGMGTGLSGGQQAVHMLSCWQWSLLLDCDLHEAGERSPGASCRRAAFLAGGCPLSPAALLEALPGVAAEHGWQQCAVELPDLTSTDCGKMDAAARRLVSCRLQQYATAAAGAGAGAATAVATGAAAGAGTGAAAGADVEVDLKRLRQDVVGSTGGEEERTAMLAVVDGCGGGGGRRSVQQLVACWAVRGIMSCAASEAADKASTYTPC